MKQAASCLVSQASVKHLIPHRPNPCCLQDLPRTFPSNQFMATEEGQAALGRVLLAFSVHKPKIGYCQSMNYIAALLLIALERNEENAFWVLVSLIDDDGTLLHHIQLSI